MLKKFWNYQLVLSASIDFGQNKNRSKMPPLNYMLFVTFLIIFATMLDGGGIVFFPIIAILYITYRIINSQHKLYELMPVSKLYSLINIYLYILVSSFCIIVTFILIGLILSLSEGFTQFTFNADTFTTIIISSSTELKLTLVPVCISVLMVSILLPLFFIKLNFLRKFISLSVVAIATIALLLFRNTLPVVPELGKISFLESIIIMPYYNDILLILACVCMIILPVSMFISYKLYKGKRCSTC